MIISDQMKVEIIGILEDHFESVVDDMLGDYASIDVLAEEKEWSDNEIEYANSLICISVKIIDGD